MESILNHPVCGKLINDKFYFSDVSFNGLFCFDLKRGSCEFLDFFIGQKASESNLHKNCVLYGEWLFFIPLRGVFIHAYNIKTGAQKNIYVKEQAHKAPFFNYDVIQSGCYLYSIPLRMPSPLLRLDMDKHVIERDDRFPNWCKKNFTDTELSLGPRVAYKEGNIYIPVSKTDMIIRWNIQTGEGEVHKTVKNLFGIANATDGFWLITLECGDIFYWHPENGVKRYDGLQEWQGIKPYNHIIHMKDLTMVIPTNADKLLIKQDLEDEFKIYNLVTDFGLDINDDNLFYGWDFDNNILHLFFAIGQGMIVMDISNRTIEQQLIQLDDTEQIKRIESALKTERLQERLRNGDHVWECEEWCIKDFVSYIEINRDNKVNTRNEFGEIIYEKLNKLSANS